MSTVTAPVSPGMTKHFGIGMLLVIALAFPMVVSVPYYQSVGILVLLYIALAVAFDLVVGRIGALSLGQPIFLAIGAYTAGILSSSYDSNFLLELLVGGVLAAVGALLVGIPSFRLSMHSFAIATLGFAISAQLIALNWVDLTGGPLCTTGIQPMRVGLFGLDFAPATYVGQYYVAFAIALLAVVVVWQLTRRRVGLALTAVRDDDVLAGSRGIWPTEFRLFAFVISAVLTSIVGAYMAHMQTVVCPNIGDISYTIELLIMVYIGGRGSLRGVITAAVLFTALPQALRMAEEWRLVIYGAALVVIVTTVPDGIEQLYRQWDKLWRKLTRSRRRGSGADPGAGPSEPVPSSLSSRERDSAGGSDGDQ